MSKKTILEIFEETVKANAVKVREEQERAAITCRDKEKLLEKTRAELMREWAIFEKLKGEYAGLEAGIEAEVRAGLEQTELTRAKVDRGEADLGDLLKAGGEPDLRKMARAASSEKLAGALKLIRAKSSKIYEFEAVEAEAVYGLAYSTAAAPQLRLAKMKEEIEGFQRSLNPAIESLYAAGQSKSKAEENCLHAQGKHVFNIIWDRITVPEIRDLLFDGRIPEALLPQIEAFLATADEGALYRGVYMAMMNEAGTKPYIGFTEIGRV